MNAVPICALENFRDRAHRRIIRSDIKISPILDVVNRVIETIILLLTGA
jgi:hypothetical protein